MADTPAKRDPSPSRTLLQGFLDDRVLLGAFVVCLLLVAYQLSVTLLQPSWIKPATDWLRTVLAWPQLLVVAAVALHLSRSQQPGAVAWTFGALGMLSYAVARTTWTIADVAIYPHGVPFPSLPDLFFILQYPCFFLSMACSPALGRWLPGVRTLVDGLLWMSAITALSWYFVLLPIHLQTSESPLAKHISMGYQVGDLALFYGLVMMLTRPHVRTTRLVVGICLLILAAASLFIADIWATVLLFHPRHTYRTGSVPDLFWLICYLLIPLAAVVRLRLSPAELPPRPPAPAQRLTWRDVLAGMQFVAPSLAVVVASLVIVVGATFSSPTTTSLLTPIGVSFALLLLALLRPAAMYVEQEQLRRERDVARAQERAVRLANERMEAFLSMVAHELNTPLTSLIGNLQLLPRRLDTLLQLASNGQDYTGVASKLRALIEWCDQSAERIARLVEDMLDETRVRRGRLALRLARCDLNAVVREAVAEQMRLNPERSIRWVTEVSAVPVLADAGRIQQVITNYLSNALKFSPDDQAVEVCMQMQDEEARIAVHDDGVGIPLADQPHIWERYYQAEGVHVKSGSQVGFGVGLYLSKAIIEGHHGQVGVQSAAGQGTTFWFTLPLASSETAPHGTRSSETSASGPFALLGSGKQEHERPPRDE
jgi:signal transduction histidine kinase